MITGEGWSGSFKVSNIFDDMSRQDAAEAIIVFDEFDKLCEPKIGSGGTNHSFTIQNELFKLIEGTTVRLKNFNVDTSTVSFIFCGSV
ncbi:MAG: AAA family ATPase [Acetatifactor sp.]|nr:AAA family ATPase [Acetatifactor sp.]